MVRLLAGGQPGRACDPDVALALGGPADLLRAAAASGWAGRPLVAPLAAAAAGELQALEPRVVLTDATKLSNLVRELTLSLGADVATAEFGTCWDAEQLGVALDWSAGMPRPQGCAHLRPAPDFAAGRGMVVLEAVRRLRALLAGQVMVAASVTGPVRLAQLTGISPLEAARAILPAVQALLDAGAELIWVAETSEPPPAPEALAQALTPVWGTVAFYHAVAVLHLPGEASGWADFVRRGGTYLPCFCPDAALDLASILGRRAYGVALPPGPPGPATAELAARPACVLVTHDGELAGRVPARELGDAIAALRQLADARGAGSG